MFWIIRALLRIQMLFTDFKFCREPFSWKFSVSWVKSDVKSIGEGLSTWTFVDESENLFNWTGPLFAYRPKVTGLSPTIESPNEHISSNGCCTDCYCLHKFFFLPSGLELWDLHASLGISWFFRLVGHRFLRCRFLFCRNLVWVRRSSQKIPFCFAPPNSPTRMHFWW